MNTEDTKDGGVKVTMELTKEERERLKNGFPPPPSFGPGNHRHNHGNCPGGTCFDGYGTTGPQ